MLKEESLEKVLTPEDSENYHIASVYIKIVCLFRGGGFGWELWEDGNLFVET